MSDFGADIFDDEPRLPPAPPPPKEPRKTARRKAGKRGERTPKAKPDAEEPNEAAPKAPEEGLEFDEERAPATRRKADGKKIAVRRKVPARSRAKKGARPATREIRSSEAARRLTPLERWIEPAGTARRALSDLRVAVLLDLLALQEEARKRGGELSFRRLLGNLAGGYRVVKACCYLAREAPPAAAAAVAASGFEVRRIEEGSTIDDLIEEDLRSLPAGVDAIVIAPGTREQIRMAEDLTDARVETAGLDPIAGSGADHRQLGRECVFIP